MSLDGFFHIFGMQRRRRNDNNGMANINEDVNRIQIASNGTFITSYQIFMQTWNDLFQIYMSNDEQSMIIKSTNVKIEITNLELSLIALINSNGIKIDDQRLVPYRNNIRKRLHRHNQKQPPAASQT